MLPEGWKRVPLHEIAEIRTGLAKGKLGLRDPIELPYLRVANVQDGHFDLSEVKTIPVERANVERYTLKAGDVLMTEGGDFDKLGRGAVWTAPITPCLHQNHVFAVRPQANCLDSAYLSALSASTYGRTYFLGCAKRSTNLASINSSQLKAFPVRLPPIREQEKMSCVLGVWDEAITTTEKLLANSRKQKQALMNTLLGGKRRLLKVSAWRRQKLSDLIVESRVHGSAGDVAKKITVKLYGRGVVAKGEKRAGSDSTQYYRRKAGQFIYSKLDFLNGAFGLIPAELDGYESTLDLPAFDFRDGVDPRWFLHYVSREDFYLGHLGLANGGRKARRVNPSDLLRVVVEVPEIAEQRAIAEAIDTAIADEKAMGNMVTNLKAQKLALMQQLLTGKRRVRLLAAEEEASVQ